MGSATDTFHEASSLDRRQPSHKGYKGRSGSEDVAHFDVVFNLQKPDGIAKARARQRSSVVDIASLVRTVAADTAKVSRGVQAVHAEVMRRLASTGSAQFVDYSDVRSIYESVNNPDQQKAVRVRRNGRSKSS